jgi:hypothetical protein
MLCHDSGNGYKSVALAQAGGGFAGTDWQADMRWCTGKPGAQLHIGDFNGDRRDDMLCHDSGNGYKSLSYSDV